MERGNTKHGAKLDESMAAEVAPITHGAPVESRVDEVREAEPFDPSDLGSDVRDDIAEPETPAALAHEETTARSELARFIPPSTFPASADELLVAARREGATDAVLAALERVDSTRHYDTVQQVWEVLGGDTEHRPRPGETGRGKIARPEPEPEPLPEEPVVREAPAPVGPCRGRLLRVPIGLARLGVDLAALTTWTVAEAVSGVARRIDRVREQIAEKGEEADAR